ncbi:MAG: hypothetical protein IJL87_09855 [Clostridia bacterium]|nr:hypothetical protein [Clostridia bacterium]
MNKDTTELMEILKNTDSGGLENYQKKYLSSTAPDFYRFTDEIIKRKKLKRQDIIIKADMPQKYGYKLLSGEAHTTDRDKIIRLCLAMEMTLEETQTALKLYGMSALYPKIKRDAVIIVAITHRILWVDDVNDLLVQEKEQPLG